MVTPGDTVFRKQYLLDALWSYGEDSVAESVTAGLAPDTVGAIAERFCELTYTADPASKSGNGYPGDKALALAAVQIIDDPMRPLARARRRKKSS